MKLGQEPVDLSLAKLLGGIYGDYDYGQDSTAGVYGHFTDKGKLPWHPTFSDESVYSTKETPGGSWTQSNGKWEYTPTPDQLRRGGDAYLDSLANYFRHEKGKGIDSVKFPSPYVTPKTFKEK